MIELEQLAHESASDYAKCEKCNGICKDTGCYCDKNRLYVCDIYWNGYHTALIAMKRLCESLEIPITEVEKTNRLGFTERSRYIKTKNKQEQ